MRPTWAAIDLEAIAANVARFVDLVGDAELCAVVKADGYGHGAVPVARTALRAGATWLAGRGPDPFALRATTGRDGRVGGPQWGTSNRLHT